MFDERQSDSGNTYTLRCLTKVSLTVATPEQCNVWRKSAWIQFNSRWYICAREGTYALHPVSQEFPQCCPCMKRQFQCWSDWRRPFLVLSRKTTERLLCLRLSPPGDRWCGLSLTVATPEQFNVWRKSVWLSHPLNIAKFGESQSDSGHTQTMRCLANVSLTVASPKQSNAWRTSVWLWPHLNKAMPGERQSDCGHT